TGGFEADHVLHAALAEAAFADNDRTMMVLQAGTDDLTGAGTGAVDKNRNREAEQAAGRFAAEAVLLADAWLDRDNQAVVDEHVADLDGTLQEATRVVAEIEDQALEAVVVLGNLTQSLAQIAERVFTELHEADVADPVLRVDDEVPVVVVLQLGAQDRLGLD